MTSMSSTSRRPLLPVDTASQTLSFGHAAGLPVHLFCDAKAKIFQKICQKGEYDLVIDNQSLQGCDLRHYSLFSLMSQEMTTPAAASLSLFEDIIHTYHYTLTMAA